MRFVIQRQLPRLLGTSLLCLWGMVAFAQQGAFLSVSSNLSDGRVYADSVYLGMVAEGGWSLEAGTYQITLVPFEADAWLLRRPSQSITVVAGDSVHLQLNFPYTYRVETVPYGALVWVETDTNVVVLGKTPLIHTQATPITSVLHIEKEGYFDEDIQAGSNVRNQHSLVLRPIADAEMAAVAVPIKLKRQRRHRWIDFAAAGLALGAGAVSVYYKFKADDLYDAYQESTDPELTSTFQRYDRYAAVALGTMQVSVGVLAFRLVLR